MTLGPVAVFISWCAVRDLRCFAAYPLAGLFQAGFDHRLLERSPDVLAYADALTGSSPFRFHNEIKDGPVAVFISWCAVRDLNP